MLRQFARHYQTGEPLPDDLLRRFLAARQFGQGFATVEYENGQGWEIEVHWYEANGIGRKKEKDKRKLRRLL